VRALCRSIPVLVLSMWLLPGAAGYSVLTHEAIIDAAWGDSIRPLLLRRFPDATRDELRTAHAYAYGGAIIQDMGYYPFGSHFFSDLTHYVRSGDFVEALLAEATSLDEYAFALGSLAHYAADNAGHPIGTNRGVAIMFPKLGTKFGRSVTYAQDPVAHLKVEFSFDVEEVAEGHYAPEAYHDFIGFEVAKPLLERAFAKTYSLEMKSVFFDEDLALGTYRHTVYSLLPSMSKIAWQLKKDEINKAEPSVTRRTFIYNVSHSSYHKRWAERSREPGFGARFWAFILRLVPKIGPFKALAFTPPTPAVQNMFMHSFNNTLDRYRCFLAQHKEGSLRLPNENFDTGEPIKPGAYPLADHAYAKLVDKVHGKAISDELRANILAFYADLNAPLATRRDAKNWAKLLQELDSLKNAQPSDPPKP
jgi:hypothetical protein